MRISLCASLLVLAGLLAFPDHARAACDPAQPRKVIFYPDEAQLLVEEQLTPIDLPGSGKVLVIALPSEALRESLTLSINGRPAVGYYWAEDARKQAVLLQCNKNIISTQAMLPENETSPERRALLERVVPLAQDVAAKEGDLEAIQARLDLWEKTLNTFGPGEGKESFSAAEEAAKLDAAYAERYPALLRQRDTLRRGLEDAQRKLAWAQRELADHDSFLGGDLLVIPYNGDQPGTGSASYSYVMPATCGLGYRFDARPDKGEFNLAQDATVAQNSGFAWNGVDLYLSTAQRDKTLRPSNIHPWKVGLVDKVFSEASEDGPVTMMGQNSNIFVAKQRNRARVDQAPGAEPPAPVVEEFSTFRIWSLGKRSIASGIPITLPLASDNYPATFVYTLRPALSPKGFLTAQLDLPKALELPSGMAQVSVDGTVVGRQSLSFAGHKGEIYFGSDPQVSASVRDIRQSSGTQGVFSKEETRSWHWEITVTNGRSKPVNVVVEDAAPVSVSEEVSVVAQSSPAPEEVVNTPQNGGARVFRWKGAVGPDKPMKISHQITVVAPVTEGKELKLGR